MKIPNAAQMAKLQKKVGAKVDVELKIKRDLEKKEHDEEIEHNRRALGMIKHKMIELQKKYPQRVIFCERVLFNTHYTLKNDMAIQIEDEIFDELLSNKMIKQELFYQGVKFYIPTDEAHKHADDMVKFVQENMINLSQCIDGNMKETLEGYAMLGEISTDFTIKFPKEPVQIMLAIYQGLRVDFMKAIEYMRKDIEDRVTVN